MLSDLFNNKENILIHSKLNVYNYQMQWVATPSRPHGMEIKGRRRDLTVIVKFCLENNERTSSICAVVEATSDVLEKHQSVFFMWPPNDER
jgi:hypothetical protein